MKGNEPRTRLRPLRVVAILLGVSALFAATVAALVCHKTGLQPRDLGWFEGWKPSNLVIAILGEARHEVIALAVAGVNLIWLLVHLHARDAIPADVDDPGAAGPSAGPSNAVGPDAAAASDVVPGDDDANDAGAGGADADVDDADRAIGAIPTPSGHAGGKPSTGEALPSGKVAGAGAAARAAANADAQLEIAAGELTRLRGELADCRERLDAANAARSRFLANMSHELRTPMNGIIGMTDLLLGGELPARERRFAQSIAVSSNALLGVISDLLDFSGIESGTLTLERSRFRVRDAVEDVCAMLAERAHEKGIELMCYVDENVPALADGDASRLRQVLDNVIRNAIAFTDEGEVVVRVSREEERGARSLYRCDVEDTGRGISPEMQMTMFDAFTQEDVSSTRHHGGLGLGLAIVRELVAMMNGTIVFRSRLGEGTRFGFTVELDNAGDEGEDGVISGARSMRGTRVLVVDDNETNRTILHHQLGGWGVIADTVESGEEALERLHETSERGEPYDLLVLDLHMPGMDGLELARRIQGEPRFGAMRSLMLTSAALELGDRELAALGIDRYVSKPPRQSVLHESLVSLLGASARAAGAGGETAASLARGTRVLLAEDNVSSQDVATGLLEGAGCAVDLATDGHGALERAAAGRYDLILMDCRMPGIDGYAATATIRSGDGPNRATPIVALTASAMKGDRERCLEAGMDDYLAKPLRSIDLNAVLVRWLSPALREAAPGGESGRTSRDEPLDGTGRRDDDGAGEPATESVLAAAGDASADDRDPPASSDHADEPTTGTADTASSDGTPSRVGAPSGDAALPPSVDDAALDAIRALQRPGKPDLLTKVLGTFTARTPAILEAMHEALDADDAAALGEQVHSLKSSSAYVGAVRLSALCNRLERASADGDAEAVSTLVARMDDEFAAVSATLSERTRAA